MLTRIRNAVKVKSKKVDVLRSKLNVEICKILKHENFIEAFEEIGPEYLIGKNKIKKYISIKLKYKGVKQEPYITDLKRISKPGLRIYTSSRNISRVFGGIGVAVFAKRKIDKK